MNITRDTLGHLENPSLILVKASGERVGALTSTSKVWVKKFNGEMCRNLNFNNHIVFFDGFDNFKLALKRWGNNARMASGNLDISTLLIMNTY